ncbi:hypothetical protein O6H91_10G072500 [Diphasiastrum complanatum]|uniref:Uncharacterized protein n=1 Tax=Diphasiastrum complanatum TaxID=34168 RepID=A0ACC2CI75_DIPCM|nr:hypothetical protein O6H91_10G072500 [Diphasiastrum complanatum]
MLRIAQRELFRARFSSWDPKPGLRLLLSCPATTSSDYFQSKSASINLFRHPLGSSQRQHWCGYASAPQVHIAEAENTDTSTEVEKLSALKPTTKEQKPRVVVLGSGWAGCRLMKDLDTRLYDLVCISPRNHMVFTPLLASTCVGTLEFRSVAEPVRTIQPALSKSPNSHFFLANCTNIDAANHEVYCEAVAENPDKDDVQKLAFKVAYDKLIIASGAQALTFGIHGVKDHAIFLREVSHARDIRGKLLQNLMLSEIPGVLEEEKKRLLHCVVVGGGPTGVEFSGELADFIRTDVRLKYPHVKDYVHVTLIESGVRLMRGVVKDVQPGKLIISDDTEVPFGLLVWSTGVGASEFVRSLQLEKAPGGRIGVDDWLRVAGLEDVYAIGDCAGYLPSTGKSVLPALAQVAERQGKYLARSLNKIARQGRGRACSASGLEEGEPFIYRHLGSMATVGRFKALVDLRESKEAKGISWAGFLSWVVWRSAYLTRVVSWRNRFYVAVNWTTTFIFGRDTSKL